MDYKILKEGEEGFGILVEHDSGFISQDFTNIITETTNVTIDMSQPIYYFATLQKYGLENRNGRIYPEDILKREVEKYREVIRRNASFHELDHPQESVISLKGGSPYRIVDMFWKDNVLIGKLELLVSKGYRQSGIISCNGDLLAHYLEYGMTVGVSSRGIGTLKKVNGRNIVQPDFELICWDAVSSPSTPGSYIYKSLEDFAKYDEKNTQAEPMVSSEKSSGQMENEFMSRLSKFLDK